MKTDSIRPVAAPFNTWERRGRKPDHMFHGGRRQQRNDLGCTLF